MIGNARNSCSALLLLALAAVPITATAKDAACAGVTKKCTKDQTYDKTINGSLYSCYDCKQTLCKDGGSGGISGTATSSVCTEKATTFRPISLDDQSRGGDTLAPKPAAARRPGRDVDPRSAKFDEADALFGKRLRASDANQPQQRDHRTGSAQTTRDHRGQSNRTKSLEEIRDGTNNTLSAEGLRAPSELAMRSVSPTALTLAWRDNSTDEFGVELYRADPNQLRRDPEKAWKLVGTFQERNLDKVAGTGMRSDEDAELSPSTWYCYRIRAYSGFRRTQVSGFSEVACGQTTSSASPQTGATRSFRALPPTQQSQIAQDVINEVHAPPPSPAGPTPVPYPNHAALQGVGGTHFSCEATESDGILCSCEGVRDCTIMARSGVCDGKDGRKDDTGCAPALDICNCTLGGARVTPGPDLRPRTDAPATHNAPTVRDHRTRSRAPTVHPAEKPVRHDQSPTPKD